ncbi:transcriptional regulator [Paenibacillus sp. CAA11]|uniref:helix-turn-helix transcriptional regulator n=1 Tax=Paenibacillus sp. CAA11 TaxID=1532905 RepID=UPI000D36FE26|nr:WYL domain-containing protein [Paenibacillus sp. CAA11]AWB43029.1 transcriptional regulator [Paenibacillus sp. CAA11]
MRVHRLIAILLLIESRGRMKAKELAEALETSVRSIYRDVDTLAEAGVPIVALPGPQGGIQLMEGSHVALNGLHGDEVIHLYLTGMGIYSPESTRAGLKLKNALLKLEKTLPDSYQPDLAKARSRFYYDERPWWSERAQIPCLETLRTAVWRSRQVLVKYGKTSGYISSRLLSPYGLVVKRGEWYLAAFCRESGGVRTFKCERILEARLTDDTFDIPEAFTLQAYWHSQEEQFKQETRAAEHYAVVLKIIHTDASASLMSKLDVMNIRQEGENLFLTVNMFGEAAARRDVLELIGQAQVLEPPELKAYAREQLQRICMLYEENLSPRI